MLRSRQYQPLAQLVSVTKPAEFGGALSLWLEGPAGVDGRVGLSPGELEDVGEDRGVAVLVAERVAVALGVVVGDERVGVRLGRQAPTAAEARQVGDVALELGLHLRGEGGSRGRHRCRTVLVLRGRGAGVDLLGDVRRRAGGRGVQSGDDGAQVGGVDVLGRVDTEAVDTQVDLLVEEAGGLRADAALGGVQVGQAEQFAVLDLVPVGPVGDRLRAVVAVGGVVVGGVVLVGDDRAVVAGAGLGGGVVDHGVRVDLDAGRVTRVDHGLELGRGAEAAVQVVGVGLVDVPPVVVRRFNDSAGGATVDRPVAGRVEHVRALGGDRLPVPLPQVGDHIAVGDAGVGDGGVGGRGGQRGGSLPRASSPAAARGNARDLIGAHDGNSLRGTEVRGRGQLGCWGSELTAVLRGWARSRGPVNTRVGSSFDILLKPEPTDSFRSPHPHDEVQEHPHGKKHGQEDTCRLVRPRGGPGGLGDPPPRCRGGHPARRRRTSPPCCSSGGSTRSPRPAPNARPPGTATSRSRRPQEHIQGRQWWTSYQPVSYRIAGRLGDRDRVPVHGEHLPRRRREGHRRHGDQPHGGRIRHRHRRLFVHEVQLPRHVLRPGLPLLPGRPSPTTPTGPTSRTASSSASPT